MRTTIHRSVGRVGVWLLLAGGFAAACGSGDGKRNAATHPGEAGADSGGSMSAGKSGSAGMAGTLPMGMAGEPPDVPLGGAGAGPGPVSEGGEGGQMLGMAGMPSSDGGVGGMPDMPLGELLVVPRYATNGVYWNDYVKADGTSRVDATDVACDAATDGPTYEACIHAGEVRAASVPGRASCAGLTAADSLGVLDWTCVVDDNQAWVVSTALKSGKHLADLLDFATGAWKELTLTASDGDGVVAVSQPAVWWSNTVRKLTAFTNTVTAHDVLLNTTGSTGQIIAYGDKIAYVTDPAATHPGQVSMRGNFLWAEPRLTGNPFIVDTCGFVVIRGASLTGAPGNGLSFFGCKASVVEDVVATGNGGSNAAIRGTGLRVARVTTAATTGSGTGVQIGNDTFALTTGSFEDLSDTGSTIGITVAKTTSSSFKRLSSTNAVGATSSDGALTVGDTVTASSFEDLNVINAGENGIYIYSDTSNYRHLRVAGTQNDGFTLRNSAAVARGNRVEDLRIADAARSGSGNALSLQCYWNVLQNISVSGVGRGLLIPTDAVNLRVANLYLSAGDTLAQVATNSNGGGIVVQNYTGISSGYRAAVIGSTGHGLTLQNGGGKYIGNALLLNNDRGLNVSTAAAAPGPVVRNLVALGSTVDAIAMDASRTTYDGKVNLGKDSVGLACTVPAGATGMTDLCTNEAPSTATIAMGGIDTATVVGPVTSDAANASDAAGLASYAGTLDFLSFDNFARAWGTTGAAAWPSVDQQGRCEAGDTCQIYDFSLLATDTVARNIAPLPSGADFVVNNDKIPSSAPTAQADCDTHSPGSVFLAGAPNLCQSTFLKDAVELLFDGIGDDDNLCESNETCLFSPNAGAYQGHGNLISAGTFIDGTITGVTLMKYETNGR